MHEQAEYLLNDEIAYAESLRATRRTLSTLLLVVVGVGIFRFDLFRQADEVLAVPVWAAWTIRVVFVVAFLAFVSGVYFVYTERGLLREFRPSTERTGAALSVLYLRQDVLDEFMERPPLDVLRMRTEGLRLAYRRLRASNRRVRRRLASGTALLLAGLFLVLLGFVLYTFAVEVVVLTPPERVE